VCVCVCPSLPLCVCVSQVALDPPLRQGQTRYNFLVFQLRQDEEMSLTVKLTEYVHRARLVAGRALRMGRY
jgi:hypothetical protein